MRELHVGVTMDNDYVEHPTRDLCKTLCGTWSSSIVVSSIFYNNILFVGEERCMGCIFLKFEADHGT